MNPVALSSTLPANRLMKAEVAGLRENRRVPSGPPVGVVVGVRVRVCVATAVPVGDGERVGENVAVPVNVALGPVEAVDDGLAVGVVDGRSVGVPLG